MCVYICICIFICICICICKILYIDTCGFRYPCEYRSQLVSCIGQLDYRYQTARTSPRMIWHLGVTPSFHGPGRLPLEFADHLEGFWTISTHKNGDDLGMVYHIAKLSKLFGGLCFCGNS